MTDNADVIAIGCFVIGADGDYTKVNFRHKQHTVNILTKDIIHKTDSRITVSIATFEDLKRRGLI